jgi:hypothetical protein
MFISSDSLEAWTAFRYQEPIAAAERRTSQMLSLRAWPAMGQTATSLHWPRQRAVLPPGHLSNPVTTKGQSLRN